MIVAALFVTRIRAGSPFFPYSLRSRKRRGRVGRCPHGDGTLYIATVMVIAVGMVDHYANSRAMMARIAPESPKTNSSGLYALSGEANASWRRWPSPVAKQMSGSQQWGMAASSLSMAIGIVGLAL